jgi:hypothetical protein
VDISRANRRRPDRNEYEILSAADVRKAYEQGRRDFAFVDIDNADLSYCELVGASFYESSMRDVNLSHSILTQIQLKGADVSRGLLTSAWINASDLIGADFQDAVFDDADLTGASMQRTNCARATFRKCNLAGTSLSDADFDGADLTSVRLSSTDFADFDVRPFCIAKRVKHTAPSSIDARTVMRSYTHPRLKEFMASCGVPQLFIDYMVDCAWAIGEPLLKGLMQSTFISYGGPDEAFANRLHEALRLHGVVSFFFPVSATAGARINDEVFHQIQKYDRILLVCSKDSLTRPGVINEIRETLDREARDGGATYLLPIMLDSYVLDEWKVMQPTLAERIARRVIADFRNARRSKKAFDAALERVIDALKVRRP